MIQVGERLGEWEVIHSEMVGNTFVGHVKRGDVDKGISIEIYENTDWDVLRDHLADSLNFWEYHNAQEG